MHSNMYVLVLIALDKSSYVFCVPKPRFVVTSQEYTPWHRCLAKGTFDFSAMFPSHTGALARTAVCIQCKSPWQGL